MNNTVCSLGNLRKVDPITSPEIRRKEFSPHSFRQHVFPKRITMTPCHFCHTVESEFTNSCLSNRRRTVQNGNSYVTQKEKGWRRHCKWQRWQRVTIKRKYLGIRTQLQSRRRWQSYSKTLSWSFCKLKIIPTLQCYHEDEISYIKHLHGGYLIAFATVSNLREKRISQTPQCQIRLKPSSNMANDNFWFLQDPRSNLANTANKISSFSDFPGGAVVKNPPANAGDTGSSPGPGRSHMLWSN